MQGAYIDAAHSIADSKKIAANKEAVKGLLQAINILTAAADRFVRLRMKERYRDLMALVEFGNEAYVVTPFTNDYDNILMSLLYTLLPMFLVLGLLFFFMGQMQGGGGRIMNFGKSRAKMVSNSSTL